MRVGTRTVNVRLDDSDAEAVLLAVPLGEFGRGRRLSLPIESNEKERGASGLEIRGRAKDTNQFGVEDVHGVRLHRQAGPWFLLSHACLKTVDDFLGLADVEIRFLEGSTEATRHFSQFFLVQLALVLEQPKRAEDAP